MTNYLSGLRSRFLTSTLSELSELFGDKIAMPEVSPVPRIRKGRNIIVDYEARDRIFNQWRTFWVFLSQVLSFNQSCREALIKAQLWLWHEEGKKISSDTSAYCQARQRLNQQYLDKVNHEVVEHQQKRISAKHLWCGRDVKVVDGSSTSMPDTKENQECYPQPSGQKKGCGFPVMRIAGMFSLATGAMLACRKGSLHVSERTLWHEMWEQYQEGDIALADCGFCSFADYYLLKEKKVDCVMRLHQTRKEKEIIKIFNKNDYLVLWDKGKKSSKPNWMTPEQWDQLPKKMLVRHVKVAIDIPGIRTKNYILATTLLDPKEYPPSALAELYRRRWIVELFFRDIKATMRMKVLHCKTPKMIHKELTIFIIAYNLIRFFIWDTALSKGIAPYRISFKGAMDTILHWTPILPTIKGGAAKRAFIDAAMAIVAGALLPIRKEIRREPRAIKRRPNANYQRMTKPRREFREIQHRKKYKKMA